MDHLRFVLMMILAAPVKAPVAAGDSAATLQLLTLAGTFVSQVKVNGFVAWIIEEMKQSKVPALTWISTNTPWVTRGVALIGAALTHLGIHWTFSGSTLVVTGLSMSAIAAGVPGFVYNTAQNYLFQHAWWKVAFATPRPVTVAAPVPAPGQP